jgi:hypothetical protein
MYYLVSVDQNGMAAHLTRNDCEGSYAVVGTDDDILWNDSEEDGNVRSECEEDEGTDCEDGYSDMDWYK